MSTEERFKPYAVVLRARESELRATERAVLNAVAFRASGDGEMWAAAGLIAHDTDLGTRTVERDLARLEALGILVPIERRRGCPTRFRIAIDAITSAPRAAPSAPRAEVQSPRTSAPRAAPSAPRAAPSAPRADDPIDPIQDQDPERDAGPSLPPPEPDTIERAAARARQRLRSANVRAPDSWRGLQGDELREAQLATDAELVRCLRSLRPVPTADELEEAVTHYVVHAGRWWPPPGAMVRLVAAGRAARGQAHSAPEDDDEDDGGAQLSLPEPLPPDLEPDTPRPVPAPTVNQPPSSEPSPDFAAFARAAAARRAAQAAAEHGPPPDAGRTPPPTRPPARQGAP